jgi:hypothetical protein
MIDSMYSSVAAILHAVVSCAELLQSIRALLRISRVVARVQAGLLGRERRSRLRLMESA